MACETEQGPCSVPYELHFQSYAEMAAGLGCACACCQYATNAEWLESEEFTLHDYEQHRNLFRDALSAVSNPSCRALRLLERCEACTGSCGLDTARPRAPSRRFKREPGLGPWPCGQDDLECLMEDLITAVAGDGGLAEQMR